MSLKLKVRKIKFGFILVAVLLTALLFLWPSDNDNLMMLKAPDIKRSDITDSFKAENVKDVESTNMLEPRFSGQDEKGQRWDLSADNARQSGGIGKLTLKLDNIKAVALTDNDEKIVFSSALGSYNKVENKLMLSGGVKIQAYNFTMETPEAISNLVTRTSFGTQGVKFSNHQGELFSNSFELYDNGNKIRLHAGVKAQFQTVTNKVKMASKLLVSAGTLDIEQSYGAFFDGVKIEHEGLLLGGDLIEVFFNKDINNKSKRYVKDNKSKQTKLKEVAGSGNITLVNGKDSATSENLHYNPATGIIKLSGNVVMVNQGNVLKGDVLIYDSNLRTMHLETSQGVSKQVKATFMQDKNNDSKDSKDK